MERGATRRLQEHEDSEILPTNLPTCDVIGVPVTALPFDQQVREIVALGAAGRPGHYVCVANVHMLVEARQRPTFHQVMTSASIVTPDGMPLVWIMRGRGIPDQERVAGMDLLPALCSRAAATGVPVFLMGATDEVLGQMRMKLAGTLPELEIAGMHAPPFRALTEEEDSLLVARINRSNAGLLLVALGCPKQEEWMHEHRTRIRPTMVGLGAAFGVYAGLRRRAPVAMQRSGLEWLFRLAQEPKRLWRRYLGTNTRFLVYLLEEQLLTRFAPTRSAED